MQEWIQTLFGECGGCISQRANKTPGSLLRTPGSPRADDFRLLRARQWADESASYLNMANRADCSDGSQADDSLSESSGKSKPKGILRGSRCVCVRACVRAYVRLSHTLINTHTLSLSLSLSKSFSTSSLSRNGTLSPKIGSDGSSAEKSLRKDYAGAMSKAKDIAAQIADIQKAKAKLDPQVEHYLKVADRAGISVSEKVKAKSRVKQLKTEQAAQGR